MLILPLIDLLILAGTGLLGIGFVLKVVAIATVYRPSVLGFSSLDFVLLAAICWGLALTLVARSWLRLNEPRLHAARQELMRAQARSQVQDEFVAELDRERAATEAQESARAVASSEGR